ncbi:MAG: rod shape-determining protein MreC [Patescibacteria group bacterium]
MTKSKSLLKIISWLLLLLVLVYLGASSKWLGSGQYWRYLIKPLEQMGYNLHNRYIFFLNAPQITEKLADLKIKNTQVTLNDFLIQKLQAENNNLRQLLKIKVSSGKKIKIGSIISRLSTADGYAYVIDLGKNDGLSTGDSVVIKNDNQPEALILLGILGQVDQNQSQIWPLSNYHTTVVGQVLNQDKVIGLVRGEYNLGLRLGMIPATDNITPGSFVFTSHLNDKIPAGLLIGKITVVDAPPSELFKSAIIEPPFNLEQASRVGVLFNDL